MMMGRFGRATGLVVLSLASLTATSRGDDDSPELSAPGDRAEAKAVAKPADAAKPAASRSRSRPPVLIVPGVSRGTASQPKTRARVSSAAAATTTPSLELVEPKPADGQIRATPRSLGARSIMPLEPAADEVFDPFRDAEPLSSTPNSNASRLNDAKRVRDLREPKRIPLEVDEDDIKAPVPPARSRSRFSLWPFNRRPTPAATKPAALSTREKEMKPTRDDLNSPLPLDREPVRPDPAVESALKRTLEKRIGEVAGDRLKDVEVLVIDRRVIIRARVQRFWQRAAVRKAIESLQELHAARLAS